MFFNNSIGQATTAVDVCKTPTPAPVPVPYPNLSNHAQSTASCTRLIVKGSPAHNIGTMQMPTNGDQAGVLGGIVSNTIMGPCEYATGSVNVNYQGLPAARFSDTRMFNTRNAFGAQIAPSQINYMCLR